MKFTKATYHRAIRLAEIEVYSRADVLQWAKDQQAVHYRSGVGKRPFPGGKPATWFEAWLAENQKRVVVIEEARTEYFKALDLLGAIKYRAKREGKLK